MNNVRSLVFVENETIVWKRIRDIVDYSVYNYDVQKIRDSQITFHREKEQIKLSCIQGLREIREKK